MFVTKPRREALTTTTYSVRYFPGSTYDGRPPQVVADSSQTTFKVSTDTRLSHAVPSYRMKIRQGVQATSSFAGTREYLHVEDGVLLETLHTLPNGPQWFFDKTTIRGPLFSIGAPTTLGLSEIHANNQALQRFISDARSMQTTLQGIVIVGELGQTLRMINGAAKGIHRGLWNYINSLRKGTVLQNLRRMGRKARLNFIRNRWLEASFGWLPLVHDIDDAMNTLATDRSLLEQDAFISGYGEDEDWANGGTVVASKWRHGWERKEKVQIRYYGKVWRNAPNGGYYGSVQPSGWDQSNWLPSLWELIPYSFLADYFFNIQHLLSAWSFNRCSLRWQSKTIRRTYSVYGTNLRPIPPSKPSERFIIPGSYLHMKTEVVRSPLDTLPFPVIEFTIPGCGTKWINMIALFGASRSVQKLIR
jgi:hypothetical protein